MHRNVSVLIFVESIDLLCQWTRLFATLLEVILSGSECVFPTLGMFCVRPVPLTSPHQEFLWIVDRLVSGVLIAKVAVIVYE